MRQRRRRQARATRGLFQLPLLPFLSLMLGLMSVMALTTMGISVERRSQEQEAASVTLVGVPAGFIPLHFRCLRDRVQWRDQAGEWQELSLLELVAMVQLNPDSALLPDGPRQLREYLLARAADNRTLSFVRRQYTVILWVEPEGVYTEMLVEMAIDAMQVPLRIGLLPILPNESLSFGGGDER